MNIPSKKMNIPSKKKNIFSKKKNKTGGQVQDVVNIKAFLDAKLRWYARSKSWLVSSNGIIFNASCNPDVYRLAVSYPRSQTLPFDEIEPAFREYLKDNTETSSTPFCTLVAKSIITAAPELISDIVFMIVCYCYDVVNLSKHSSVKPIENSYIFLPLRSLVESIAVSADIEGGGTRGEFACNVLFDGEEPWNKWCFIHTRRGHILFDFEFPVRISAYMLKSANDVKERDPKAWRVFGLPEYEYYEYWEGSDQVNAILLDSRKQHEFVQRWQSFRFDVTHPEPPLVKSVLIVIDEYWVYPISFAGIQLGQIAFYGYL